ncbi:MAG TPA: hypothetical protein VMU43_08130 [Candidatus Acidoferrum sp.]|nr:hypothetical protein [Candidatus Acidoferrum sp.]
MSEANGAEVRTLAASAAVDGLRKTLSPAPSIPHPRSRRMAKTAESERRRTRREYNRNYMREQRSHGRAEAPEVRIPRKLPSRSKHGQFRKEGDPALRKSCVRTCGLCGRLPAVCVVTRLRMTEETASGFRTVRVPYCGHC